MNEEAPANMPDMSVTAETFQEDRSPSNLSAPKNAWLMLPTLSRLGLSDAAYSMFVALANIPPIEVHSGSPQLSSRCSLAALAASPDSRRAVRPPDMWTV